MRDSTSQIAHSFLRTGRTIDSITFRAGLGKSKTRGDSEAQANGTTPPLNRSSANRVLKLRTHYSGSNERLHAILLYIIHLSGIRTAGQYHCNQQNSISVYIHRELTGACRHSPMPSSVAFAMRPPFAKRNGYPMAFPSAPNCGTENEDTAPHNRPITAVSA